MRKIRFYCSVLFFLLGYNFLSIAQIYDYTPIKGAGDYYNYAEYRMYIPDTVTYVRGVYFYIAGSGGDSRGIVLDPELTELCNKNSFALLGGYLDFGSNWYPNPEFCLYKSVLRALNDFAEQSKHEEIKVAPLFLDGYSWGGFFSYWFTWWKPSVVIGYIAQKFDAPHYDVGLAKYVPGYILFGEFDQYNPTVGFELNRPEGALWGLAMEPGGVHARITDRNLFDQYFQDIIDLRLPEITSPEYPLSLNTVEESTGWLGNRSTFEIAQYNSFPSDKTLASWFPTEEVAQGWQSFIQGNGKNSIDLYGSDAGNNESSYLDEKQSFFSDSFKRNSTQNSLVSAASATFLGIKKGDQSGYCVSSAGDVNGDGFNDILIGAYGVDGGPLQANFGETYLILGREEADWGIDFDLSQSDASFFGEKGNNRSGYSVAAAGDVNGDGLDDFLIGAFLNGDGGNSAGKTYLILGRSDADWGMKYDLSQADASFIGEAGNNWSGAHVSAAGDVNGDGFDDFLIGAEGFDRDTLTIESGATYLILGQSEVDWGINYPLSQADASFIGESDYDYVGYSLAPAGDVNGDGFDDFMIGTANEGVFLFLGKSEADWGVESDLSQADASFIGEMWFDFAGGSIASAGDVNDDGFDDILIGAPDNCESGYFNGQTYLILGNESPSWGNGFNLSNADASFIGESPFGVSGYSVASAGDFDGDGLGDFLIGAPNYSDEKEFTGKTYLLKGRELADWGMDRSLSTADFLYLGEEIQDLSGYSVASAGDMDNDGKDDILIGAWHNGDKEDQAGKTYLLLGKDIVSNIENENSIGRPSSFFLSQNYPNPFNPTTKIEFTIPKSRFVKLEIYNAIGQRVKVLLNKQMPAGNHEVQFSAGDLVSGIYLYRIETGKWQDVKKMILLK